MQQISTRRDTRTVHARRLRREATPAEKKLWAQLRLVDVDGHFRRQAPVGAYFADFAHHGCRLIVELDGDQHGQPDGLVRDARRTADLEAAGYKVLRFWNHEIRDNLHGVVETILAAMHQAATPPTLTLPTTPWGEGSSQSTAVATFSSPPPACGGEGQGGGR